MLRTKTRRRIRDDIAIENTNYVGHLNSSLNIFFKDFVRVSLTRPGQAFFYLKTVRNQLRAARKRKRCREEGIHVPPMMIFSITTRCNLHCKGCYSHALQNLEKDELSDDELQSVIAQADDLGISFIMLAGGEPLIRPKILEITEEFPHIIFLIFTNGTLLSGDMLQQVRKRHNLVPVVSLEGHEEETDFRRGEGIYRRLHTAIEKLKGTFFSVSITVSTENLNNVTSDSFIQHLADLKCRLFFFVEYSPVTEGTDEWVLTDDQRQDLAVAVERFRKNFPGIFISVPGDEEQFGGCLSAGRGFIHVSAEGRVEPCPFAPYSDSSLREMPLKEALQSKLLEAIRTNPELIEEDGGGCALWKKREALAKLAGSN
jgi:MoaA/NifB/PqqE/SkfB family radical SAM enzyme